MNQQDQINIIKAHMAGKRVLERQRLANDGDPDPDWVALTSGEYTFDFRGCEYKIEPLPGIALAGDFFDKNDPLRVVTDPDEIAALIQRKKS